LAHLWKDLLVGRAYKLPKIAKSYNLGFNALHYKVGQPMGALSSWALLALTHHAIVQLSARRCGVSKGKVWFSDYALLGDDIVIANKAVANEYLRIMERIGVKVGLAKSLVSHTRSLEFAKRTYIRGRDASPISLAEVSVALKNVAALAELLRKNDAFKKLKVSTVARFVGFGYKNLAKLQLGYSLNNRLSRLIAYITRPGGIITVPFEVWLSSVGPGYGARLLPHSVWHVAKKVWETLIGAIISSEKVIERSLFKAYSANVSELCTPKGEIILSFWKEWFSVGDTGELNSIWKEWIFRPTTDSLRERFESIDDQLRILSPKVMPEFSELEGLWKRVFDLDEGLSALPKDLTWVHRDNEEPLSSARIINWWVKLRPFALRDRAEILDLRAVFAS